eukprot:167311-Pyramimonas_sp.AAC.1
MAGRQSAPGLVAGRLLLVTSFVVGWLGHRESVLVYGRVTSGEGGRLPLIFAACDAVRAGFRGLINGREERLGA